MAWVVRLLLVLAAPIAALIVPRDAINFGVAEALVAIMLITVILLAAAVGTHSRTRALLQVLFRRPDARS